MRTTFTACAVALAALLGTARAVTVDEIVRPQRDAIDHCNDARSELARQFALRLKELEEVKAWHESLTGALADQVAFLAQENARAKAAEDTYVSRAGPLTVKPGDQAWIPTIGWGIFGFFEKHRDDTNKAIAEAEGAIARGETSFHIEGAGWLTGKSLAGIIAADTKGMADQQAIYDRGEWNINYPGLGWVGGTALTQCVADNQKKIAELQDVVSKGEFSIHVVNVGWVTRNSLQAMIDGQNAQLKQIEAAASEGSLSIHRAISAWTTLKAVHEHMDATKKTKTDYEAASASTASFNVPSVGWTTGEGLDAAIAALEKEVAGILQTASDGKYAVPSGVGWVDMNAIRAALALPDCLPKDSPQPCLAPEHRPLLQDAQARVPIAVDTDVGIRRLRIDVLKAYRAEITKLAEPRQAQLDLDLAQWGRLQDEFTAELGEHRKVIARKVKWLQEIMQTQMPGGA
ncbi:MAG: hypothetical protein IT548_07625 [Alphaproteobacteria bacterium]|nr:hypothetical protein [Alphaproteobacteria bacterium]